MGLILPVLIPMNFKMDSVLGKSSNHGMSSNFFYSDHFHSPWLTHPHSLELTESEAQTKCIGKEEKWINVLQINKSNYW